LPQHGQVPGQPFARFGVILWMSQPGADDEAEDADDQRDRERRRNIDLRRLVVAQSKRRVQLPHDFSLRPELAMQISRAGIFSEQRK
jgi:hypothetical protein